MSQYAKAIVGAIIAGLGTLYLGLDDGVMTTREWVATASTTLTALGVVWGVPNITKNGVNVSRSTTAPPTYTVDDQ